MPPAVVVTELFAAAALVLLGSCFEAAAGAGGLPGRGGHVAFRRRPVPGAGLHQVVRVFQPDLDRHLSWRQDKRGALPPLQRTTHSQRFIGRPDDPQREPAGRRGLQRGARGHGEAQRGKSGDAGSEETPPDTEHTDALFRAFGRRLLGGTGLFVPGFGRQPLLDARTPASGRLRHGRPRRQGRGSPGVPRLPRRGPLHVYLQPRTGERLGQHPRGVRGGDGAAASTPGQPFGLGGNRERRTSGERRARRLDRCAKRKPRHRGRPPPPPPPSSSVQPPASGSRRWELDNTASGQYWQRLAFPAATFAASDSLLPKWTAFKSKLFTRVGGR